MTLAPHWLIALVAAQRAGELIYARRNTARLLSLGGYEVGGDHYPIVIAVHAGWIATLWLSVALDAPISWFWLVAYLLLQAGRVWVMATLGPLWTTRIVQLPYAPIIRTGPYRYCRHPNYLVVACEIAVLPLVFGLWKVAVAFSIVNAAVLAWRIHVENAALAARPGAAAQ